MKALARIALQPFSYATALAAFIVTILPASIVSLPFNVKRRVDISGPFWRAYSRIILKVCTLARVHAEDRRSEEAKRQPLNGLYIANHQSFVDIPLIFSYIQIPPIMKKEIFYIPVFGFCAYAAGALMVDRKNASSRRDTLLKAQARLTKGLKALQVYPEGTRQKQGSEPKEYGFIKKALLKFAFDKKIPVYPISMYGTKHVINSKTGFINHGQKIGIIIKDALDARAFQDSEQFMKSCWQEVLEGHKELQEKLT